jgi:hypothetical protein
MCFSASASFIAGGALTAVGVVTLKKTEHKKEIPFAAIPLLFGIQQLIEGVIWLTFRYHAPELNTVTTYIYSLFSHVLWPIFVPFSIVLLETAPWRKKILWTFWGAGTLASLYLLYFLIKFPIAAQVMSNHIVYVSPHFYIYLSMGFYVAATCISSLFSSHKLINIFGVLSLLSFIGAYLFYSVALVSVWCFFAAILSSIIFLYFKHKNIKNLSNTNILNPSIR